MKTIYTLLVVLLMVGCSKEEDAVEEMKIAQKESVTYQFQVKNSSIYVFTNTSIVFKDGSTYTLIKNISHKDSISEVITTSKDSFKVKYIDFVNNKFSLQKWVSCKDASNNKVFIITTETKWVRTL